MKKKNEVKGRNWRFTAVEEKNRENKITRSERKIYGNFYL
jgi:hypothetical protein